MHSENGSFAFNFKADPRLTNFDVFLDPSWETALAMNQTGDILERSEERLATAIQSDARVLLHLFSGSEETEVEVKDARVNDDG